MARLALSPVPSRWLVVLLLLLSAGEMVPAEDMNHKGSTCSGIWQHPRFIAKKRGSVVTITCYLKCRGNVTWLWQPKDLEFKVLKPEEDRILQTQGPSNATLIIKGIQPQDSGIYLCQQQHSDEPCGESCDSQSQSCGTELQVTGLSTLAQFKRRNTLKDGIIMIQTMLIIIFIIVPIFLLLEKDDGKAGTEEDHTYEGLNIDQTATYEDIVTLRTGEVKWSVGEHPGQE